MRVEQARTVRPFDAVADVAQRARLQRTEIEALSHAGAFACFGLTRRQALWQAGAIECDATTLLARIRPTSAATPVPAMSPLEETLADYAATTVTTGQHLLAHLREELQARGRCTTRDVATIPDGQWVTVVGHVIVRQRPGTAKGFCFLTLEDETGTANVVIAPAVYERVRLLLNTTPILEITGPLQRVDGVTHLRAREVMRIDLGGDLPAGHDYR